MFRQDEICYGGWKEMTLEKRRKRQFEAAVQNLPQLSACRFDALTQGELIQRLENCWQDVERKPLRAQQMDAIWSSVFRGLPREADMLSVGEHELAERALILGGRAPIEDWQDMEAAKALSLRLWACVGIVSGKPVIELERPVSQTIAKIFSSREHEVIRCRMKELDEQVSAMLYQNGAMDDRIPQKMILRDVVREPGERSVQLARHFLWASFDCMDYDSGVMLLHAALAEPYRLPSRTLMRKRGTLPSGFREILPEEVPLQHALECAIDGALRKGENAVEVVNALRLLCKQGAPLAALEEVLQSFLIVMLTSHMRRALLDLYHMTPKWIECAEKRSEIQ